MITRIDHIALYCNNLEGMKVFFEKYFHACSNALYHNPKTGLRTYILSFPNGGTKLEIMTRPEANGNNEDIYRMGFIHISFAFGSKEDIDRKTTELSQAGYPILSGPRTTGDGFYESCIKGFEGILIEITV